MKLRLLTLATLFAIIPAVAQPGCRARGHKASRRAALANFFIAKGRLQSAGRA